MVDVGTAMHTVYSAHTCVRETIVCRKGGGEKKKNLFFIVDGWTSMLY